MIENVGDGPEKLMIVFVPPEEFGFDLSRSEESKVGTILCANGGLPHLLGGIFTGKVCHFVRETADGVEMRSRFWIGQDIVVAGKDEGALVNRFLNTKLVKKRVLPQSAHHLAHHCAAEFADLAHLLPILFAEYEDRF